MRRTARHLLRAAWIAAPLALVTTVLLAVAAAPTAMLSALATPVTFSGTPTVGALFTISEGRLGTHFCTASVVQSPEGNLILTAAHCLEGYSDTSPASIAFVPDYNDGTAPAGIWMATRIFVDQAWAASADPDDDFAFLTVAMPGQNIPIESVTGAESLGVKDPSTGIVRVIGYPDSQNQPIICKNRVSMFSPTQTEFDCDGYTMGVSGGPFLVHTGPGRGAQTVIGVIGGYQQGGDSPDVSYAAAFGPNVQALYDIATSQG